MFVPARTVAAPPWGVHMPLHGSHCHLYGARPGRRGAGDYPGATAIIDPGPPNLTYVFIASLFRATGNYLGLRTVGSFVYTRCCSCIPYSYVVRSLSFVSTYAPSFLCPRLYILCCSLISHSRPLGSGYPRLCYSHYLSLSIFFSKSRIHFS
ncbi:hypothetical protein BD310DRAFT_914102 [Dichomitus squalens]|uniref:Uncharacterized protein n=1 Tax=Dichomitus squalens TaxID=114155 RepID=A0A4V2K9T4_9APHY|nr:hypothetical protein BD310DRAFT_914102 [Dichomitus squalens]